MVDFNALKLPAKYLGNKWELLYPAASYVQSLPDSNGYEGMSKNDSSPTFPHQFGTDNLGNLRRIPAGNTYTFDAAKSAISGETMGKRGYTDFLCLSISGTDYVGHNYTSNSMEIEDEYLRLDKDIAAFLLYLDQNIGAGNYLFFLTADHGVAHNAQYLKDRNVPAGNQSETTLGKELAAHLTAKFKKESVIRGIDNYQVLLNDDSIEQNGLNRTEVKSAIRAWLLKQPHVAYVVDMENIDKYAIPEVIREKAINGYNRNRSGSLLIINNPGWYHGYAPTGTTHSTWHPYDTHIPLVWYGWKIPKGKTNRTVHMEDIATTIASLLHLQMPNGCIGNVITEIVK
jgi:hypothetical protein